MNPLAGALFLDEVVTGTAVGVLAAAFLFRGFGGASRDHGQTQRGFRLALGLSLACMASLGIVALLAVRLPTEVATANDPSFRSLLLLIGAHSFAVVLLSASGLSMPSVSEPAEPSIPQGESRGWRIAAVCCGGVVLVLGGMSATGARMPLGSPTPALRAAACLAAGMALLELMARKDHSGVEKVPILSPPGRLGSLGLVLTLSLLVMAAVWPGEEMAARLDSQPGRILAGLIVPLGLVAPVLWRVLSPRSRSRWPARLALIGTLGLRTLLVWFTIQQVE